MELFSPAPVRQQPPSGGNPSLTSLWSEPFFPTRREYHFRRVDRTWLSGLAERLFPPFSRLLSSLACTPICTNSGGKEGGKGSRLDAQLTSKCWIEAFFLFGQIDELRFFLFKFIISKIDRTSNRLISRIRLGNFLEILDPDYGEELVDATFQNDIDRSDQFFVSPMLFSMIREDRGGIEFRKYVKYTWICANEEVGYLDDGFTWRGICWTT